MPLNHLIYAGQVIHHLNSLILFVILNSHRSDQAEVDESQMYCKESLTTNSLGMDGLLSSFNTVLLEDIPVFIAMLFHLQTISKATSKAQGHY